MKNAQIQSQIFVYLTALIGIAIFLVYAFKFVLVYQNNIYTSEMVTFVKDFKDEAVQMAMSYGSTRLVDFKDAPNNYKEICFLDLDYSGTDLANNYPVINNIISSNNGKSENSKFKMNVFLVNDLAEYGFYAPNMRVSNGFFCKNLTSKLSLRFVGQGNSVLVKPK